MKRFPGLAQPQIDPTKIDPTKLILIDPTKLILIDPQIDPY